jgi:hypothetical protein
MTTKHPSASPRGLADTLPTEFKKRAAKVEALFDEVDAMMADAVELTDAERKTALRIGDNEIDALSGVIDFAEARPEIFQVLAAEDGGNDPSTFETALLRGRLENARTLAALVARIDRTRVAFSDSALYVSTLVKRPVLAAYEIAKPHATRDREHGKKLNAAVDLYRARSIAGQKTRVAKKSGDAAK